MVEAQATLAGHLIVYFFAPLAVIVTPIVLVAIFRFGRKLDQVWIDFVGQPARPGVDRRPGVMERLKDLERLRAMVADMHHELADNDGSTVKDKIEQINTAVHGSPDG